MRNYCELLTAIFNEIRGRIEDASVMVIVGTEKQGGMFSAVSGDPANLAAFITVSMYQSSEFAEVVKMAAHAYEHGPRPTELLSLGDAGTEVETHSEIAEALNDRQPS
jgi:hypothetical protein